MQVRTFLTCGCCKKCGKKTRNSKNYKKFVGNMYFYMFSYHIHLYRFVWWIPPNFHVYTNPFVCFTLVQFWLFWLNSLRRVSSSSSLSFGKREGLYGSCWPLNLLLLPFAFEDLSMLSAEFIGIDTVSQCGLVRPLCTFVSGPVKLLVAAFNIG